MNSEQLAERRIFCAIVGAGLTGIALADKLLGTGTLKRDELVIIDRSEDFGGVWLSNKYPGVACDIPSHAYVMRSFLNPLWTKKFSEGKEIQQYYSKYASRRELARNAVFNTYVHEARFNEETLLWEILVQSKKTGEKVKWIANVLFDNGGGFHRPKYAKIPGRDIFRGEQWHTSEWPQNVDLTGKRVALIGTGPSAAQVAPKIQPVVDKLYMYQRSSGHVLPRQNFEFPSWVKTLFSWCYPLLWLYHVSYFVSFDRNKDMWISGTKMNQDFHDACITFLEDQVKDPVTREKLRPTTEFACKRVLFLDDWYSMYNESNVELITEKPLRITERGIVSKSVVALRADDLAPEPIGSYEHKVPVKNESMDEIERPIDVLIWGTGFDMNDSGGHFEIFGLQGKNLSQLWRDYPKTYWGNFSPSHTWKHELTKCTGVAVTQFPNLFLTLGPNSTNYWSNLTTVVDIQTDYHYKMVKRIKKECRKGPYALFPNQEISDNYNNWLKNNRGSPSFLSGNCATYHKAGSNLLSVFSSMA
ncbi:unnamed protein product [Clonostachys byssicola]|uniref:FAD/NAD(P)-binding domain-containing protein n=1 Tax=Clonostachys byssicola TaxID=160290 RepID=A0A9N9U2G0_9HYPO|nr:unnamed protein product [Clonostachys byssicola]